MRVLVQFRSSPAVHAATLRGEAMPSFAATTAAPIPGLIVDPAYTPVQVPTPQAAEPGASPYLYSPAVSFSSNGARDITCGPASVCHGPPWKSGGFRHAVLAITWQSSPSRGSMTSRMRG